MKNERQGKSTPGPWYTVGGQEIMARDGAGSILIAQSHAGHREERGANARLIAAAPDLLEACQRFVDYYTPFPARLGNGQARKSLDEMAKAVSKAKGGTE